MKPINKIILRRIIISICAVALIPFILYAIDATYTVRYGIQYDLMAYNLKHIEEYPDTRMLYARPILGGIFYEVGVYPELTDEMEERIKAYGYPFDNWRVSYIGTDSTYVPDEYKTAAQRSGLE